MFWCWHKHVINSRTHTRTHFHVSCTDVMISWLHAIEIRDNYCLTSDVTYMQYTHYTHTFMHNIDAYLLSLNYTVFINEEIPLRNADCTIMPKRLSVTVFCTQIGQALHPSKSGLCVQIPDCIFRTILWQKERYEPGVHNSLTPGRPEYR
jgi:hypothetical protein